MTLSFLVLGLSTHSGLSVLVSSQVPEGKGVSSSASVEVASMMALIRCFELEDTVEGPREIALLAQKVWEGGGMCVSHIDQM